MKIYLIFNLTFSYLLINSVKCSDHGSHHKCNDIFNKALEKQNPSAHNPPKTDSGGPIFKYPFAFTRLNEYCGGWFRTESVTDLSIATEITASLLRLKKYGVRELHWHDCPEFAYIIEGEVRITFVDADGRAFVGDARKGDMFYIPQGLMHSIQGLCDDGALLLVVFSSGTPGIFNVDDWLRHLPKDVLAKNFRTSKKTFDNIPKTDYYIFEGKPPNPLNKDMKYATKVTGPYPQSLIYRKEGSRPNITRSYGTVRIVDQRNFPVTNTSAVIIKLKKGCLREPHWNLVADVLIYFIKGKSRLGVFFGKGLARTQDLREGDIAYVKQNTEYYIENTGDCELKFIEILPNAYFADISIAQWWAHTPPHIVDGNLHTGKRFIRSINKTEQYIVGCP